MKKHTLYLSTRDELTRLCLDDVMFVTADGNYVKICLRSGRTLILLASLQNIEELVRRIPDVEFLRIGRSHIINTRYLAQANIHKRTIIVADDVTKEQFTISVPKEAIRGLKEKLSSRGESKIPDFFTHNGRMDAYLFEDSLAE